MAKKYTGYLTCVSHSVHVFEDAKTLQRDENTMRFLLDEDVNSDEDVKKLGIRHGDVIAYEPRFDYMKKMYLITLDGKKIHWLFNLCFSFCPCF